MKISRRRPAREREGKIFFSLPQNLEFLRKLIGSGMGLIESNFFILDGEIHAAVVYIDSMAAEERIARQVILPLLHAKGDFRVKLSDLLDVLQARFIIAPEVRRSRRMKEIVAGLFNGDAVLFIDGLDAALIIGSRQVEKRAIQKPDNEVTVLASMDSFTEDLQTNVSLVIRRLPTPKLRILEYTVGALSQTKLKLIWLEGIAGPQAVSEAERRIQKIDLDWIDGIGFIAELIEDKPLSIFPKYLQTQRPDVVSRYLAEGHFAILASDSPFAFIAPVSFWDNFKTMDDYSERPVVSSFLRLVRYLAFLSAILASPMYLAFVTYNHSVVPPALALNIAQGRHGVPFPSIVELLIMSLSISIIREASLRIPGSIGFFVGTLAAVVIGQASVSAGYVSASVIIVVAISAISSYAIARTSLVYPARLIDYGLLVLAGVFGMFGLINGIVLVLWHLVSQESFGVPYSYPVVPFDYEGMKDTFIRAPLSMLRKRFTIRKSEA